MQLTSAYPVLMTTDVAGSAAWFREHFGFESTFEADWYVSLRNGDHELALLDPDHETVPAGFRGREAGGMLVNLEVADVDAVHEALVARGGLTPVLPLRDETFGQRHFIVEGPAGVLVDVIQPIDPGEEYAAAFVAT